MSDQYARAAAQQALARLQNVLRADENLADLADTAAALANLGIPGAAGYGEWEVAGSWAYSVDVTQVDFTGLAAYRDLRVALFSVTTSGAANRWLRVSTDNGVSFYAGATDYQSVATTGVETAVTGAAGISAATTAAATAEFKIEGSNVTGEKFITHPTTLRPGVRIAISNAPIDAVRVLPGGGINMTGGSIIVSGRK